MSTYQIDAPAGATFAESGLISSAAQRGGRLISATLRLLVRALAENRTRQAVRELQRLDDRMLKDIGIKRDAIEHAVRYGRELDVAPFARAWASWGVNDPFRH